MFFFVQKLVAPVLKSSKTPPDSLEEYKTEFGYLGQTLHLSVTQLRTPNTPTTTTPTTNILTPATPIVN